MRALGPMELVLILTIAVVLFGASRLGEVGGAMGKSIREFKKASSGDEEKKLAVVDSSADSKADAATNG